MKIRETIIRHDPRLADKIQSGEYLPQDIERIIKTDFKNNLTHLSTSRSKSAGVLDALIRLCALLSPGIRLLSFPEYAFERWSCSGWNIIEIILHILPTHNCALHPSPPPLFLSWPNQRHVDAKYNPCDNLPRVGKLVGRRSIPMIRHARALPIAPICIEAYREITTRGILDA